MMEKKQVNFALDLSCESSDSPKSPDNLVADATKVVAPETSSIVSIFVDLNDQQQQQPDQQQQQQQPQESTVEEDHIAIDMAMKPTMNNDTVIVTPKQLKVLHKVPTPKTPKVPKTSKRPKGPKVPKVSKSQKSRKSSKVPKVPKVPGKRGRKKKMVVPVAAPAAAVVEAESEFANVPPPVTLSFSQLFTNIEEDIVVTQQQQQTQQQTQQQQQTQEEPTYIITQHNNNYQVTNSPLSTSSSSTVLSSLLPLSTYLQKTNQYNAQPPMPPPDQQYPYQQVQLVQQTPLPPFPFVHQHHHSHQQQHQQQQSHYQQTSVDLIHIEGGNNGGGGGVRKMEKQYENIVVTNNPPRCFSYGDNNGEFSTTHMPYIRNIPYDLKIDDNLQQEPFWDEKFIEKHKLQHNYCILLLHLTHLYLKENPTLVGDGKMTVVDVFNGLRAIVEENRNDGSWKNHSKLLINNCVDSITLCGNDGGDGSSTLKYMKNGVEKINVLSGRGNSFHFINVLQHITFTFNICQQFRQYLHSILAMNDKNYHNCYLQREHFFKSHQLQYRQSSSSQPPSPSLNDMMATTLVSNAADATVYDPVIFMYDEPFEGRFNIWSNNIPTTFIRSLFKDDGIKPLSYASIDFIPDNVPLLEPFPDTFYEKIYQQYNIPNKLTNVNLFGYIKEYDFDYAPGIYREYLESPHEIRTIYEECCANNNYPARNAFVVAMKNVISAVLWGVLTKYSSTLDAKTDLAASLRYIKFDSFNGVIPADMCWLMDGVPRRFANLHAVPKALIFLEQCKTEWNFLKNLLTLNLDGFRDSHAMYQFNHICRMMRHLVIEEAHESFKKLLLGHPWKRHCHIPPFVRTCVQHMKLADAFVCDGKQIIEFDVTHNCVVCLSSIVNYLNTVPCNNNLKVLLTLRKGMQSDTLPTETLVQIIQCLSHFDTFELWCVGRFRMALHHPKVLHFTFCDFFVYDYNSKSRILEVLHQLFNVELIMLCNDNVYASKLLATISEATTIDKRGNHDRYLKHYKQTRNIFIHNVIFPHVRQIIIHADDDECIIDTVYILKVFDINVSLDVIVISILGGMDEKSLKKITRSTLKRPHNSVPELFFAVVRGTLEGVTTIYFTRTKQRLYGIHYDRETYRYTESNLISTNTPGIADMFPLKSGRICSHCTDGGRTCKRPKYVVDEDDAAEAAEATVPRMALLKDSGVNGNNKKH